MSGFIIIVLMIMGSGAYHLNHKRHLEMAKEFVERYSKTLERDLVLHNVNHIIKDESGELKFIFNSDVFREIYPDELEIVSDENKEEVEIMHSLRLYSINLKNLKIRELSKISTEQIKNEAKITIRVTKKFINQHII